MLSKSCQIHPMPPFVLQAWTVPCLTSVWVTLAPHQHQESSRTPMRMRICTASSWMKSRDAVIPTAASAAPTETCSWTLLHGSAAGCSDSCGLPLCCGLLATPGCRTHSHRELPGTHHTLHGHLSSLNCNTGSGWCKPDNLHWPTSIEDWDSLRLEEQVVFLSDISVTLVIAYSCPGNACWICKMQLSLSKLDLHNFKI